jgi:hypothetical protein
MALEKDFSGQVRKRIGELRSDEFEQFCCDLFRIKFKERGQFYSGLNANGRSTKGIPDAFIRKPNDRYIAFEFTTQNSQSVKGKVLHDIQRLKSERNKIRDCIDKIVVCTQTGVHSELESYRQLAKSYNWELEFYSVGELTDEALQNPELIKGSLGLNLPTMVQASKLFDCGERLKQLREERGLLRSQFIELIDLDSEKGLLALENKEIECSSEIILATSLLTGASIEWIKHGTDPKYSIETLFTYDHFIKGIGDTRANRTFFCVDPEKLGLQILIELNNFHWKTIEYEFNLNFWDWFDDHGKIPLIYSNLKNHYQQARKNSNSTRGLIVNSEFQKEIRSPSIFPGQKISSVEFRDGLYWLEDLFDLVDGVPNAKNYTASYGDWFDKLVEWFREYATKADKV